MIWLYGSKIVLIIYMIHWYWICETQKTKDVETETLRGHKFWEMSRPRLCEAKKCEGCRDRDQPRLSKICRDRDFIESLANHCNAYQKLNIKIWSWVFYIFLFQYLFLIHVHCFMVGIYLFKSFDGTLLHEKHTEACKTQTSWRIKKRYTSL